MRNSSSTVLKAANLGVRYDALPHNGAGTAFEAATNAKSGGLAEVVTLPFFGPYSDAVVVSRRSAARANASQTTESEMKALMSERARLVQKKIAGSITRRESLRLEYVRWQIYRVEDARVGPELDRLTALVESYEKFASDLKDFRVDLDQKAPNKRRTSRGA